MHRVGLVRAAAVAPILAVVERVGASVDDLLSRAGVPAWARGNPEMLIPVCSIARLLAEGTPTAVIDHLGIVAGKQARVESLGIFGRLVRRSATLGEALDTLVNEHASFSSGSHFWLRPGAERVELCHAFTADFDAADSGWQQADHYALMLMLGVVGLAGGPAWRPIEVCLASASSAVPCEGGPLAGAVLAFGQPATSIMVPRALLDQPLRKPAGDLRIPRDALEAWRASAPAADFLTSIVQAVETLSWEGYPDIHQTAAFVDMSVRTLQRQLSEVGITHEALVGRARFATAAAVLEETDLKILEIALDLGYSDHAHFTRAFRRWAGCSPQQYRRRCRHGGGRFNLAS
jgi:AraC-like DNA-binding protein